MICEWGEPAGRFSCDSGVVYRNKSKLWTCSQRAELCAEAVVAIPDANKPKVNMLDQETLMVAAEYDLRPLHWCNAQELGLLGTTPAILEC